ncbi:MAG: flavin reductase family protein [Pseudomonadota bacterium]
MDAYAPGAFARSEEIAPAPEPALSPTDGRAFRQVLGRFATGVTVVTCASAHGPIGMTVNSFSSLSLDPPLVMWSPAKSSRRYPSFSAAHRFAIHILRADQQALSDAFMRAADAFHETVWYEAADGLPLMEGCLARFTCEQVAEHDAGDHALLIGRVTAMEAGEGDPLLYYRGRYSQIG